MDREYITDILTRLKTGELELEAAVQQLGKLPFENLGYAKIDNHRALRTGIPEVIYAEGKTIEQIQGIVSRFSRHSHNVMATRAGMEVYEGLKQITDKLVYHEAARIVVINPKPVDKMGNIAVICAGTSDIGVAEEAGITAELLGNNVNRLYDVGVAGIHRILDSYTDLCKARVAVVIAGMEGALASVVGGLATCPVIAVPTSVGYGASFNGLAALLGMLNSCAPGVSVVNIDNGFGAGVQASLINKMAPCNMND